MQGGWDGIASIGIVFPKLFPDVATGSEQFIHNLCGILEDPFFTAIELSYIKETDVRRTVAGLLQKSCMDIIFNGGSAFRELHIDLSSLDRAKRAESVENAKLLIDQCYELNARIFHIVTGKFEGEERRVENLEAFAESTKELCAYAKSSAARYTLTLSLETGDRYADRKYLLGPTNEAVSLVREVQKDCDNFGLLLDQSHFPFMQEDISKALWIGREYLTHVHLGNSFAKDPAAPHFGDKHLPFGVPDSEIGVEETAKLVRTLNDIGFFMRPKPTSRPVLSFEIGPYEGESVALVLAAAKRVFLQAWAGA